MKNYYVAKADGRFLKEAANGFCADEWLDDIAGATAFTRGMAFNNIEAGCGDVVIEQITVGAQKAIQIVEAR